MLLRLSLLLAPLSLSTSCTTRYGLSGACIPDTGDVPCHEGSGDTTEPDTGTDTGEDLSAWDDATLRVLSPSSGDYVEWGSEASFEAALYDSDGETLEFDDIAWSSDLSEDWSPVGASFTDASLDAGVHELEATAALPNGDRHTYAVGGVMVQHADAGTYVGEVLVDVTVSYGGQDYVATCAGSVTLVVDVYGESVTGDSSCYLSLMGYSLEAVHAIDMALDEGVVSGEAALDLTWFSYGFPAEGSLADETVTATWSGEAAGYAAVAGELTASRISRDTSYQP